MENIDRYFHSSRFREQIKLIETLAFHMSNQDKVGTLKS